MLWCTRHCVSNGVGSVAAAFKKIRKSFKELKGLTDAISLTTFVTRKFKSTSGYVHQKSNTFKAFVLKYHGLHHHKFAQYQLSQMVYCRGNRKMNQLTNADKMLYLRPYIRDTIQCKYDKRQIITAAKNY